MKRCPYCAKEIQDAAILRRHCGSDLSTQSKEKTQHGGQSGIAKAVIVLLVLVLLAGMATMDPA